MQNYLYTHTLSKFIYSYLIPETTYLSASDYLRLVSFLESEFPDFVVSFEVRPELCFTAGADLLTLLSLLRFVVLTPWFFVVVVLVLVLVTVVLLCPVVLLLPGATVADPEDLLFVTVPVDFLAGSACVEVLLTVLPPCLSDCVLLLAAGYDFLYNSSPSLL